MTLYNLQNQLNDLISNNLQGEALQKLLKIFSKDSAEKQIEVTMYLAELDAWTKNKRQELVLNEELNLQIRKFNKKVLELINEITEQEAIIYEIENSIFTKILVVCKNEARKATMTHLLSDQFYKGVQFDTAGAILPKEEVNKFQLILFDNMDNTDETYFELYKHYLANATPYLLYFGKGQVPDSNDTQVKAYFANSIFSLHSRIQEMITFLKYYQE